MMREEDPPKPSTRLSSLGRESDPIARRRGTNLVSLTPGSLSLDLSPDRSTLLVHVMFLDDAERCRREIKDGFERRVLELLR